MTPLMILIEERIQELTRLIKRAKEREAGVVELRRLRGMLTHNKQLLNTMQRRYYEEAEAIQSQKEYLN